MEVAYIVRIEVPVNSLLYNVDLRMREHMRQFSTTAEVARHFVLPREDEMPGRTPQLPFLEEEMARVNARQEGIKANRSFRKDLEDLINKHAMENHSNTPDFILAHFMHASLVAYDKATVRRDEWYLGKKMAPGQVLNLLDPRKPEIGGVGERKEPERILPVYNHVLGQEMEQAVNQAIGAASVCWESLEGTGEFQSDRALRISKELLEIIVDFAQQYAKDKAMELNSNSYQAIARNLVFDYVQARLDKSDPPISFSVENVYVVWFAKTLQNWKALVSTTLPDGMYYEVTCDGNHNRVYVDAYKKVENVSISLARDEEIPVPG